MDSESSDPKISDRSAGKWDHVVYIDDLKTKSDASKTNSGANTTESDGDKDDSLSNASMFCLALSFCGTIGFIGYVVFGTTYDICVNCPHISITSVDVSSLKSGAALVSAADIVVGFISENSRHGGNEIEYDDIRASVYYKGSFIAVTSVYPFKQDPKEVTERKVRMRVSNIDWVSKANINKTHHDGILSFDITISSPSVLLVPSDNIVDLIAFCDGVCVKFTNMTMAGTGSMIGGSKDCHLVAKGPQNH